MSDESKTRDQFFIPFAVGLAIWLLAYLVQVLSLWPASGFTPIGGLLPFVAGIVALGITAAVLVSRGKLARADAISVGAALVVPGLWAAMAGFAIHLLRPGARAGDDFLASVGLLTLVFCGFGLLYASRHGVRPDADRWIRLVLPPIVAVALVSAYVTWTIVTSTDFENRNAFAFQADKVDFRDPGLTVDATFEIKKAGKYVFDATSFSEGPAETVVNRGRIDWDGKPAPSEIGRYHMKVVWEKFVMPPVSEPSGLYDPGGELPLFEVRLAESDTPLRQFPIALPPKGH